MTVIVGVNESSVDGFSSFLYVYDMTQERKRNVDAKLFGQFIAEIRKEKHMTQADLAKIIGVTDKAVSRWERGVGFPDISTLEPLAKALDVSVLELMRSRRSEMNNQNLSENEVTEIMSGAVEMARENQKQEKISLWIGGAITIGVAILVRLSGRANLGGSLVVGFFAALAAVSIFFFTRNREDRVSRKIYGFFLLVGVYIFMALLEIMKVDSHMVAQGVYAVLFLVVCLISK